MKNKELGTTGQKDVFEWWKMSLKRTKGDYEVMSDKLIPLNFVKAMMSMERLYIEG